jgi:prepilin peptidase CpaA
MLTAAVILIRAVSIALLLRIAWLDFEKQKITNRDIFALGLLGLGGLALTATATGSWTNLQIGAIAGALLFLALFPFWLLRKVGAGDVKLMAVAPLVAGGDHLFAFALGLLAFALLTIFLVKNPIFLPDPAFRKYVQVLERKNIVPFGVPISASLLAVMLLQAAGYGAQHG